MIKVEDKEEIRRLYFWRRWSIRKIARELGHSRKTVRKALLRNHQNETHVTTKTKLWELSK